MLERSQRGCDWTQAIEDSSSLPSVLGMYILPTVPTVGGGHKDIALREHIQRGTSEWTM